MLYRLGGLAILTDPVWSRRVGIDLGLFSGGMLPTGGLPGIDLILLTHAHFDHLDRPTLHRLPKTARIVCAHGTSDLVADFGFTAVTELRPDESTKIDGLGITAVPVKHWGPRVIYDDWRGYVGYVLEAAGRRVLHTGDTADMHHLDGTGPYDLGTWGIGAYDPYIAAHANPEQAWRMANDAGCRHVAAYHHSTFRLSREPNHEPLQRLLAAAGGDAPRVVIRQVGDEFVLPAAQEAEG